MLSIDSVILCFTLILFLPIAVLFVECIAALLPKKKINKNQAITSSSRPTVAVLIAAHDEEVVIGNTIANILPQLSDRDRLIVIADNCSDRTASIVKNFDVTLLERRNSLHQGKGYALDYGLWSMQQNPSDVVIILDADCHIQPNYIESLAYKAMASGRPVQPINLLYRANNSDLKSAISELAFVVKNLVRPQGLAKLNLPCLVTMGTAYPWSVINQVPLASGNLVEDMQLGIDLAIAGNPPLFCSDAKVTGVLPLKDRAATTQRTRWEHGHLSTLQTQVPRLIKESWRQKRMDLLAIAFDLCVPPLSFLVILWSIVATIGLTVVVAEGKLNSAICWITIEGLLLFLAIFLAWGKFGRKIIPFKSLVNVPLYIMWKLPIYFQFLIKPQQKWIRTERDIVSTQSSVQPRTQIAELSYKE
ncbi:glycosyltransferase family 2 protein [Waterburya agarophytonicola K14]|uniref:Glycosyltransferase family 2 protein n=2 Tax=Waterburya TaxID=2886915 RepID=A0A964FDZ0_9CYAN|nr:glycosyltransferase family 2 protein [Waterburya agarophytonicola KI4]